ncbi:RecX family transcriptional regulator [Flavobacterium circumlabens]|uniref:Regulatory protein RecX n=1 Tax=Flavobacterium circumlabens TaxID=2133765 RepID=A0A4Y7U643_9FLAO|nr:regulatory protein RecX [Flavobacterium circumlabens]TCN49903.1 regulatory protein [Flavobacterium circumlabens]TEB41694.1 RecX family transcriptional regulator [Flavobacterium circumlabens]
MNSVCTPKEALLKLEHFCAYQERCHAEVVTKLYSLKMTSDEIDFIVVQLIESNFLNETRFACSFARGKHRIKFWGRIRITNELKARQISSTTIAIALKEISPEEYETTFEQLSERSWNSISEKNTLKKRKKFCDYMLRRGYESNLVYDKVKELEQI